MLEATHRRIAQEIANALKFNEREAKLMEVGSVAPDSWVDFPHHHGKEDEILNRILEARVLYLEKDDECYSTLGYALHYIQDMWTLRPRIEDKHTKWEKRIDLCAIMEKPKLKNEITRLTLPMKAQREYLELVERCGSIGQIEGLESLEDYIFNNYRETSWSDPVLDLNFAYLICLEITRNVLMPPMRGVRAGLRTLHRKLDNLSQAKETCLMRLGSLEREIREFPCANPEVSEVYFGKSVEKGIPAARLGDVVDVSRVSDLFRVIFNHARNDQNERKRFLAIERKLRRKRMKWLHRANETVEFFRLSFKKDESSLSETDYVDCPSLEVARYLCEVLATLWQNGCEENIKRCWIPLKDSDIRDVLNEHRKDQEKCAEFEHEISTLRDGIDHVTEEINKRIGWWNDPRRLSLQRMS